MAEIEQEKSRGLKFAERQLLRHGWEQGKGLGRDENGMVEAIKVKVKCDKGGVGHKQGEQFTFHWWDHVFNKASASLQVESDQNGVSVKKTVEEEEEEGGTISNKKPRKASLAKAKLYGCFVKSATLLSGQEQPEPKASSSDDSSSSDDEDQRLDLSSTTKLSDADLMKACGGRTAHKGARHGLTMNAKLARLERQEAEFMAKYGGKSQSGNSSPDCPTPTVQSAAQSPEREEEAAAAAAAGATESESQRKKSKKMKKKKPSGGSHESATVGNVSESSAPDIKPKKKKKKKEGNPGAAGEDMTATTVITGAESYPVENGEAERSLATTRKRKGRKKDKEEDGEARETNADRAPEGEGEAAGVTAEENASPEPQTDADTKTRRKKSKKNKSSSRQSEGVPEEVEQCNDTERHRPEPAQDPAPKKKKKRDAARTEEPEDGGGAGEEESTVKRKKGKEDVQTVEDSGCQEAVPPKKKKKKKSKEHKMEQD